MFNVHGFVFPGCSDLSPLAVGLFFIPVLVHVVPLFLPLFFLLTTAFFEDPPILSVKFHFMLLGCCVEIGPNKLDAFFDLCLALCFLDATGKDFCFPLLVRVLEVALGLRFDF